MSEAGNGPDAPGEATQQQIRRSLETTFRSAALGDIVGLLMRSPSHRTMRLEELENFVLPAIPREQFLIAKISPEGDPEGATPAGFVLWACVSDEVDARLTAQEDGPVAIAPDEWSGGPHVWIVDLVSVERAQQALFRDLRGRVGAKTPIKARVRGAEGKTEVRQMPVFAEEEAG